MQQHYLTPSGSVEPLLRNAPWPHFRWRAWNGLFLPRRSAAGSEASSPRWMTAP
jgi:hypothetical protein